MMRLRVLLEVSLAVAVATATITGGQRPAAAADAADAPRPRTLATVSGRVYAVAQSERFVGWRTCNEVLVRNHAGSRIYPPIRIPPAPAFRCFELQANEGLIERDLLALLGGTVTWSEFTSGNSTDYVGFKTAQISGGRRVPTFMPSDLWLSSQDSYSGSYIVGPVSGGSDLLYAQTRIDPDPSCTDEEKWGFTCPLKSRGTVWRVDSRLRRHRIAATPATVVAAGGGRVALVPRRAASLGIRVGQARVVLRRLADGELIRSVVTRGEPYEAALSPRLGAVLVRDWGQGAQPPAQLGWFDPRSHGMITHSVVVAADAEALSIAGRRIVFRTGRRILSYAPGATTRPVLLAQAAPEATVVGPVLTRTRLLWAEIVTQRGKVVSHIRVLSLD